MHKMHDSQATIPVPVIGHIGLRALLSELSGSKTSGSPKIPLAVG
jgi:hypothetical protein